MKINTETILNTAIGVLIAMVVFKLADALVLDSAVQKIKEKTSK